MGEWRTAVEELLRLVPAPCSATSSAGCVVSKPGGTESRKERSRPPDWSVTFSRVLVASGPEARQLTAGAGAGAGARATVVERPQSASSAAAASSTRGVTGSWTPCMASTMKPAWTGRAAT